MICRDVDARLTAYLDGELDGATASAVRGHLRVCATCRAAAEDHARIRDALGGLDRLDAPPALWEGVLAKLGEAEIADARRPRWHHAWSRLRPHLAPAGVAVGACAAAALVIHLRQPSDSPRAAAPVTPEVVRVAPPAPPPAPRPVVTRDATAELADEAARLDARYREVAADLLTEARATLGESTAARRRFDREVAALERAVLAAAEGKVRDRAWHTLITFLERAALGERIAAVRP